MSNDTNLSEAQIELVKQTWARVVPIADLASGLFYEHLFETNPHLRPLFKGADMTTQRKKLVKAINMVVVSLERIGTLVPTIRELGMRHVAYGVEDEHYAQVGAALLWTLETGLQEDWSEEAKVAWSNAYQLLTDVMIDGARQATADAA